MSSRHETAFGKLVWVGVFAVLTIGIRQMNALVGVVEGWTTMTLLALGTVAFGLLLYAAER